METPRRTKKSAPLADLEIDRPFFKPAGFKSLFWLLASPRKREHSIAS